MHDHRTGSTEAVLVSLHHNYDTKLSLALWWVLDTRKDPQEDLRGPQLLSSYPCEQYTRREGNSTTRVELTARDRRGVLAPEQTQARALPPAPRP